MNSYWFVILKTSSFLFCLSQNKIKWNYICSTPFYFSLWLPLKPDFRLTRNIFTVLIGAIKDESCHTYLFAMAVAMKVTILYTLFAAFYILLQEFLKPNFHIFWNFEKCDERWMPASGKTFWKIAFTSRFQMNHCRRWKWWKIWKLIC